MHLDDAETGVDAQGRVSRSTGRDAATTVARGHRQAERILILESGRTERNYWSDLWFYRELFAILAWRDFAIRYKQTAVGVAWAIIRPFLTVRRPHGHIRARSQIAKRRVGSICIGRLFGYLAVVPGNYDSW